MDEIGTRADSAIDEPATTHRGRPSILAIALIFMIVIGLAVIGVRVKALRAPLPVG